MKAPESSTTTKRRTTSSATKLSDMQVRAAKAKEAAWKLSDGNNMYVYITPSGSKTFRWKYRVAGKEKVMTLGTYDAMSLADARTARHAAHARLLAGIDPMQERKTEKLLRRVALSNSFESISRAWWDHWRNGKSERHAGQVLRRFESDVFPALGTYPITEIEPTMIVATVKAIAKRGTADLAARAFQSISQVFRYAVAHGLAARNPASDMRPGDLITAKRVENFARIDFSELPDLLHAINGYQGSAQTRFAMQLLALTFVRTSELINAEWSEIDWEQARWNIPAQRMKMRKPHVVPLAPQTLIVLRSLFQVTGNRRLLFPGERDTRKAMSNNTILKALERMGYKGKMTGHGFRGLASTALYETGAFDHAYIEAQLAHAERSAVVAAYNHATYLKQRTEMMIYWADRIQQSFEEFKTLAV